MRERGVHWKIAKLAATQLTQHILAPVDAYERALQRASQYGDVHAYLAQIYARLERNQKAYDSLHRAFRTKRKPLEDLYWLQVLGNVWLKLERSAEARTAFEKIVEF